MQSSNETRAKKLLWVLETHRMLAISTTAGSVEREGGRHKTPGGTVGKAPARQ